MEISQLTSTQVYRLSGLGLVVGAVAFIAHVALRSLITAGVDPTVFATQTLWVPVNGLGVIGAALVLLGLPALGGRMAPSIGTAGLVGLGLIAGAWMFFGLFLSVYGMLVLPWLAVSAPTLVAASAPLPKTFVIAFLGALAAWLIGAVLLAIRLVRARVQPRWVGYLLPASALWMVVGDLVLAPNGPAANLAINLLSNLGPVLLLVAIGRLGYLMWSELGSADAPADRNHPPS